MRFPLVSGLFPRNISLASYSAFCVLLRKFYLLPNDPELHTGGRALTRRKKCNVNSLLLRSVSSIPSTILGFEPTRSYLSSLLVVLLALVIFLVVSGALIGGLVGILNKRHEDTNPPPSVPNNSGCGSVSAWKFDDTNHSNVSMGDRSFLVHIPPSYDINTYYPTVFSFHGYGDNETLQELITGLSEPNVQINGQVR